jgi:hypothetical protein
MTSPDELPGNEVSPAELSAALSAARTLDPAIGADAVRQFLREIAEMDAALNAVATEDAPLVSGFTPLWLDEATR